MPKLTPVAKPTLKPVKPVSPPKLPLLQPVAKPGSGRNDFRKLNW
jgi:hypothetical protein